MKTIVNSRDAADPLWINQLYEIASGGDFWESGLEVTPGSSATSITVSASQGSVNLSGASTALASEPVTLPAAQSNPRTDVIYANAGGVDKQVGNEAPLNPPDATFPSVWEPEPNDGSLVPGVPIALVHVQPGDAVSADIESWQIQDRRMQGFGPEEYVRDDELIAAIEAYDTATNGAIATLVEAAATFGGWSPPVWKQSFASISTPFEAIPANGIAEKVVPLPTGYRLRVWRGGVLDNALAAPNTLKAEVVIRGAGTNTIYSQSTTFDENADGTPIAEHTQSEDRFVSFRGANGAGADTGPAMAWFHYTIAKY